MTSLSTDGFHRPTQFERQLCSVQGKMFELSAKKNLASKEFIDFYMQSATARFFDLPYDRTQWLGEENLLYDVQEENPNLPLTEPRDALYGTEALFWMGYLYRYWHFLTAQPSSDIWKICSAETLYALYPAYHTLDCTMAVLRILEAKPQCQK